MADAGAKWFGDGGRASSRFVETTDSARVVAIERVAAGSGAAPAVPSARRLLDLDSIVSPALRELAPTRAEKESAERDRGAALRDYAARLRESYRDNLGGVRDGFRALSDSIAKGERIAVACSCRNGEFCHADVVRIAIRKVHEHRTRAAERPAEIEIRTNPRTQRAINEILAVTRHDRILADIEKTEGRSRAGQASHLGRQSQFARDLYERGARVVSGNVIVPSESVKTAALPAVTTLEFAVRKLTAITGNGAYARELAPTIALHAAQIAGTSADGETKIRVFEAIYGALEGRAELLPDREPAAEEAGRHFEKALGDIAFLAAEMRALEPSDRLEFEPMAENRAEPEISEELDLARIVAESVESHAEEAELELAAVGGIQEFERIPLGSGAPQIPENWSERDLTRMFEEVLPQIDRELENGVAVRDILRPLDEAIRRSALANAAERLQEIAKDSDNQRESQLSRPIEELIARIDPAKPAMIEIAAPEQIYAAAESVTNAFFRNRRIAMADLEEKIDAAKTGEEASRLRRELGGLRAASLQLRFRLAGSNRIVTGSPSAELIEERRFVSDYMKFQLTRPESRLRHENPRYRDFANRLETAATRSEVLETASHIRRENAATMRENGSALTPKEMKFLFTEESPAHYSKEMTSARLAFAHNAAERRMATEALLRGEIKPGPEAQQLLASLADRLNRRTPEASASATRHFLESLKTPNEKLKIKNPFDHKSAYTILPPAERDFIYEKAQNQLEKLNEEAAEKKRSVPEPAREWYSR